MRPISLPFVALVLALCTLPAFAADGAPPLPDWDRLTPEQRELLIAPVRERWNAQPGQRARMLGHAQRWRAMTPEQRATARKGVDRFQAMSPAERDEARRAFAHLRQLSPAERAGMRERLRRMTPEQRRQWLKEQARPNPAERAESRLRGERQRAESSGR